MNHAIGKASESADSTILRQDCARQMVEFVIHCFYTVNYLMLRCMTSPFVSDEAVSKHRIKTLQCPHL